MRAIRNACALVVLAIGFSACGGETSAGSVDSSGDLGTVKFALTTAPTDARCAVITIAPAGGGMTMRRQFPLVPDQPAVFDLNNLPTGMVTLSEQVFTVNCPVAAGQTPTWASDPVTVTLTAGMPVNVMFALARTDLGGQVIGQSNFPPPPNTITEFPVAVSALNIVTGPDDNLWFSYLGPNVGRITPSGTVTLFPVPSGGAPDGMTAGPDGNVWFVDNTMLQIGRITPVGNIVEFPLPADEIFSPNDIVTGRDGNLWFADGVNSQIVRMSIDGRFTEFPTPTPGAGPIGITVGPDGNVWFTESTVAISKIARITPTGTITEFSVPTPNSRPYGICAGPDGNLWFTEGVAARIGRATTSGAIVEFPLAAGTNPTFITSGPDGNLWFSETSVANKVARITPVGVVTEFTIPTPNAMPFGIAAGPDGNIWFAQTGMIGRIRP